MKNKLLISFSGGRTSAYMAWWLFNEWEDRDGWEMICVFANTGKEAEGTLFFVDECSHEWNIPIVWVEARCKDEKGVPFSDKGWSVRHVVVNYESASRNGEPYEEMCSVLGIPSTNAPFCSDQLKRKAIESYLRSIGWDGYWKAIGIRSDEPEKRVKKNHIQQKILYPLRHINKKTKPEILGWWKSQSFDLDIHGDDGNCDNCWKKNMGLLCRNMRRNPDGFEWWEQVTNDYGHLNPRNSELKPPFNFFRGNKSVQDIRELANKPDEIINQMTLLDEKFGCEESCEAF